MDQREKHGKHGADNSKLYCSADIVEVKVRHVETYEKQANTTKDKTFIFLLLSQ